MDGIRPPDPPHDAGAAADLDATAFRCRDHLAEADYIEVAIGPNRQSTGRSRRA